jgi:pimeloyl-ACP methyl ester carboxylesterase
MHFVLVHGAWHGAWCWERLAPLLESRGHSVVARDLPALGADRTDARFITLDSWSRCVAGLVTASPEPVVLVGHSRGGIIISQVAELVPERIRRLVYLAAYLLPTGHTLADEARADEGSLIAPNMIPAARGLTCTLRAEVIHEAFYGTCSPADAAMAAARLTPEPLKPLATPLALTDTGFGRVPRAYIECTRDRTISLAAQRRMHAALPCDPVYTLDSDHSPFYSCPEALAGLLGGL